jgi:hypothetical protein
MQETQQAMGRAAMKYSTGSGRATRHCSQTTHIEETRHLCRARRAVAFHVIKKSSQEEKHVIILTA